MPYSPTPFTRPTGFATYRLNPNELVLNSCRGCSRTKDREAQGEVCEHTDTQVFLCIRSLHCSPGAGSVIWFGAQEVARAQWAAADGLRLSATAAAAAAAAGWANEPPPGALGLLFENKALSTPAPRPPFNSRTSSSP